MYSRPLARTTRLRASIARSIAAFAAVLSLTTLSSNTAAAGAHQNVPVMTQNTYLGADVTPLFNAQTLQEAIAAAAAAWLDVQATDIPARAAKIADEIVAAEPALVALQEAVQWTGPDSTGSTIQYDFLQSILDELDSKGGHYALLRVIDNLDITVPIGNPATGPFVHVVDRDVVLARTGLTPRNLSISNVQAANFSTLLSIPTVLGPLTIPRSWISADVSIRGTSFRFVETHLEAFSALIQEAQAAELVAGPAATFLPVVMVGDFNSNANGEPNLPDNTPTYGDLLGAGFSDIWTTAGHKIGNTCCQEPDLLNFPSDLSERIDLVLVNAGIGAAIARLDGDRNEDRISAPDGSLWPSDHAGLIAMLKIPSP